MDGKCMMVQPTMKHKTKRNCCLAIVFIIVVVHFRIIVSFIIARPRRKFIKSVEISNLIR